MSEFKFLVQKLAPKNQYGLSTYTGTATDEEIDTWFTEMLSRYVTGLVQTPEGLRADPKPMKVGNQVVIDKERYILLMERADWAEKAAQKLYDLGEYGVLKEWEKLTRNMA